MEDAIYQRQYECLMECRQDIAMALTRGHAHQSIQLSTSWRSSPRIHVQQGGLGTDFGHQFCAEGTCLSSKMVQ